MYVNGSQIQNGLVRYRASPVQLQAGLLHCEDIFLLVLPTTTHPVLLGLPWLCLDNPAFGWTTGLLIGPHVPCPLGVPVAGAFVV